ncbi:baculoviral IAP repeat-containing protein 7 isoform X1 [Bufo gargarizans]|uniref:baculoviral IAP repeat-containing protein 7 isoform X1 n=1 Tax=Bufo gargarizans TaxID=30331 RepID=UPI001CF409CC|nr:baculoviral IAP repeat-containing protein 7 isoform X1 [Bufo gargarizans]XP_044151846.1 baculoviral IAP repeat-containing protein 7 isoform X1 [Bufo gargarizans]
MSRWHWDSSPLVGHRARCRRGVDLSMEDEVISHILGSWRPPSTMVSQSPAVVKPSMRCEASRLRTFTMWPGPSTMSPRDLAKAGFYYLGPGDRVRCFCCGGVLRCWEPGDHPQGEHRKFFPSCPFMLGREVGNIPCSGGRDSVDGQILGQLQRFPGEEEEETWQAVYPEMMEERERLATYHNWPPYAQVTPDVLARAGFFYTGHRDNVKCFHCDGGLSNWERGDDPWREHAKWFPRCEFLIQSMGLAYIRGVQDALFSSPESMPESQRSLDRSPDSPINSPGGCRAFLQSSVAQSALQMGFDENLVVSLVQSRFLLVGAPYSSVSDLVHDLIQAEEERQAHTTDYVRVHEAPAQRASSEPQPPKEPETVLSTEEQLRRLKEERLCKVCMDKDVSMVFVPCGHLVVCMDCAPNLRHCPICRASIRGSVRAFMS